MSTPTVTEIVPAHRAAREMRAEAHPDDQPRRPRMAPYDRAAERAMVRASLAAAELHTHAYDRETR